MMFIGRRETETLKIKWSDVDRDNNMIILRHAITKARKEEFIEITPPVALVLDQLERHRQGKYQKYRFIDWLFLHLEQTHKDFMMINTLVHIVLE